MSDLATAWRGSKSTVPSRSEIVLQWFTSMILKDESIDVIRKQFLFKDYDEVVQKLKDGKATKKELEKYTFNKEFLTIKKGDLTDKIIDKYWKDHDIPLKIKQRGIDGWEITRIKKSDPNKSGANTDGNNQ